jgi:hypothetical protein
MAIGFSSGCNSRVDGDGRNVVAESTPGTLPLLVNKEPAPADSQWGTIKGKAVWGGDALLKPEKIAVPAAAAVCLKDGVLFKEEYLIDVKTKGIKNVFVWLVDAKNPKAKIVIHPDLKENKVEQVVIDQPCCAFEPRALALREGTALLVKNSAPFPHSFHTYGLAGGDINQLIQPGGSLPVPNLPAMPKPITVKCDTHSWMSGMVGVFNHPYFALTEADGAFEIKDAPAGEYRLMMLHEGMGWVTFDNPDRPKDGKRITIKGGETTDLGEFKVIKDD